MDIKDRVDHRPGGLNRVLAGEERAIAGQGVTQQPFVGCFLPRLFFQQTQHSSSFSSGFPGLKQQSEVISQPSTGRRRTGRLIMSALKNW
jgi:hypothetical protein